MAKAGGRAYAMKYGLPWWDKGELKERKRRPGGKRQNVCGGQAEKPGKDEENWTTGCRRPAVRLTTEDVWEAEEGGTFGIILDCNPVTEILNGRLKWKDLISMTLHPG